MQMNGCDTIRENLPLLENILSERADVIGPQYQPYKNHVYRVVNFTFAFHDCQNDDEDKIVIAGCFHDLGMWPGDVVDYLEPSIALAKSDLEQSGRQDWVPEISEMNLTQIFTAGSDTIR